MLFRSGARPADGSSSTLSSSNWKWVTGEAWTPFNISNFLTGEPNGDSEGLTLNRGGTAKYNDQAQAPGQPVVGGFIIEIPVPEGGMTLAALGVTLFSLSFLRRKLV